MKIEREREREKGQKKLGQKLVETKENPERKRETYRQR